MSPDSKATRGYATNIIVPWTIVATAVVTTPGDVAEPARAEALVDQHERLTSRTVGTAVGDQQYGTTDLHRRFQERGLCTHLKIMPGRPRTAGRFAPEAFTYVAIG